MAPLNCVVTTCGFQSVKLNGYFRDSTLQKGMELVKARHVTSIQETSTLIPRSVVISGNCTPQTNISKKDYIIRIQLYVNRSIKHAECNCKAGIVGRCKHTAAVVVYCNSENSQSVTSGPQQWGGPTAKARDMYSKGVRITELFPQAKPPTSNVPNSTFRNLVKQSDIRCPLTKALKAEDTTDDLRICEGILSELVTQIHVEVEIAISQSVMETLFSRPTSQFNCYEASLTDLKLRLVPIQFTAILSPAALQYYSNFIRMDRDQIIEACLKTISQSLSPQWKEIRELRISGSRSHPILTRTGEYEALAESFNSSFSGNAATAYGNRMERAAKSSFSYKQGVRVVDVGVVICPTENWLCSSPDGICVNGEDIKLLEVKCPYSRRGKQIVDFDNQKSTVPFLKFKDGKVVLPPTHKYYTQIQITMYVTNTNQAYFCVYSTKQNVILEIKRDDLFLAGAIPRLKWFYFTHLLPAISKS